jgi:hypothetical protein
MKNRILSMGSQRAISAGEGSFTALQNGYCRWWYYIRRTLAIFYIQGGRLNKLALVGDNYGKESDIKDGSFMDLTEPPPYIPHDYIRRKMAEEKDVDFGDSKDALV